MNQELIILIKRYRTGQLPPEEKTAFELRLASDPEFAAEAAEAAEFLAAVQEEGDQALEQQLIQYSKELNGMTATISSPQPTATNVRKMTSYSRIVYAAAVLIGLIAVVLPLWLINRPGTMTVPVAEEVYAANFTIPPAPEARSEGANAEWREAFARKDYASAAAQLESMLADTTFTGRSEAFLYLGIAQLALNQPEKALPALKQVSEDSFDWESAQWYSALALLKLKRLDDAGQLLDRIARQTDHPYRQQADTIRKQLQRD